MKHVKMVTKHVPLKAYWWEWLGSSDLVKAVGKPAYLTFLADRDSVDPRAVGQLPGVNW